MLIFVNKTTGEIRAAQTASAPEHIDTQHAAELPAQTEDEILIDSTHQVYNTETGEVIEVPPWEPPLSVETRLPALESRVAALEARLASEEKKAGAES